MAPAFASRGDLSEKTCEHSLPFTVARAFDEAQGIDTPRIWTAERDTATWAALQG